MRITNTSTQHYLGIDPSARGTGLALIIKQEKEPEYQISIRVQPPAEMRGAERLAFIFAAVSTFLAENNVTTLTRTCVEGASLYSVNKETVLSEVRGVLYLLSYLTGGCEPSVIPPSTLKKFVTGNGGASKEEVWDSIRKDTSWEPKNNDEADACGLANLAIALDRPEKTTLTRGQLELVYRLLSGAPKKTIRVKPTRTFDI